jgi:hypothetical protein
MKKARIAGFFHGRGKTSGVLFHPVHIGVDPALQKRQAGLADVAGRIVKSFLVVDKGFGLKGIAVNPPIMQSALECCLRQPIRQTTVSACTTLAAQALRLKQFNGRSRMTAP